MTLFLFLRERLKSFVLCEEDKDDDMTSDAADTADSTTDVTSARPKPARLKVNLDHKLLLILRDVKCLQRPPHNVNTLIKLTFYDLYIFKYDVTKPFSHRLTSHHRCDQFFETLTATLCAKMPLACIRLFRSTTIWYLT